MRFTDNAELTAANMANTDILAGTDVSAQTDKKFSLAGLADWFLNRFTGLSLAGQNQSVKAALDGLNSNSGTFTFASGITGTNSLDIRQSGNVVTINGYIGGLSITSGSQIEIGTISGVKLPPTQLRFRGACGPNAYSSGSNAYFALNSQGKLYVNSAGNGSNVYFSCSYVAA